ncbi:MAG: hypothetical protein JW957_05835 [Candidatus Omnitrophica bacterium]|nr:hypothetical protein [Candidatus Omnitrophota bacterium]
MKILYVLTVIFISAMIGTALNELLLLLVPGHWPAYEILASSLSPAWRVEELDVIVATFNFGVVFNFSILTLLGIITGCFLSLRKL